MLTYSQFAFVAALITTVLATFAYSWAMSAGHRSTCPGRPRRQGPRHRLRGRPARRPRRAPGRWAEAAGSGRDAALSAATLAKYGTRLTWLALGFLTVCLALRMMATGHGPFVTQYEFATSLAWGMLGGLQLLRVALPRHARSPCSSCR